MSRVAQINELLREELAQSLNRELEMPNVLVTVLGVDCSPDFKYAKVWVSVLPSNLSGTALKVLRQKSGSLAGELKKRTKIMRIPKFTWLLDTTEKKAEVVERAIDEEEKILSNLNSL